MMEAAIAFASSESGKKHVRNMPHWFCGKADVYELVKGQGPRKSTSHDLRSLPSFRFGLERHTTGVSEKLKEDFEAR